MNLFTACLPTKSISPVCEDERLAWLRLARTTEIGPITFHSLIATYGSGCAALTALPELAERGGRGKKFTPFSADAAHKEMAALARIGGRFVMACDSHYPKILAACEDAPPVLSILGDVRLLHRPCVGMVGARNASLHGRKLAKTMALDLAATGWVVVSGLARGIDTAAHEGALEGKGGTVAVLAGGADVIYPQENTDLYARIRDKGGCILAESAFGQKPFAQHFPKRNRIISGLSRGLVVVEATLRSGSLITARMAGEQGRDVMAVPGFPADPRASGPLHLIRQGATLVRDAKDILEALEGDMIPVRPQEAQHVAEPPQVPLSAPPSLPSDSVRQAVLEALTRTPVEIDALIRDLGVAPSTVHIAVLELELADHAQRLPGGRVVAL